MAAKHVHVILPTVASFPAGMLLIHERSAPRTESSKKKSHFSMLRAHLPASQQAMKHDCNCNLLRERSFWQQCSGSMEEIHSGFRMISWKENTRLTYSVGYYTGKNRPDPKIYTQNGKRSRFRATLKAEIKVIQGNCRKCM